MNKKLAISMAALLVAAGCGGGGPVESTAPAVAEAVATLNAAKIDVAKAYGANNDTFPQKFILEMRTAGAQAPHLLSVRYDRYSPSEAGISITLDPRKDFWVGFSVVGNPDGTVTWSCTGATVADLVAFATERITHTPTEAPSCKAELEKEMKRGLGSSPLNDTVLQARWDQNIAQVAQVQSAITKCAESNNGFGQCGSLIFLTSSDFLPRTYTLVASRFESTAPVIKGDIVLVGNEEASNCTVTIRPFAIWQGLAWSYETEGGAHCNRAISPRISWSANISNSAAIRRAIEECSKKYDGILAGNCDSFSALGHNGFRYAGFIAGAGAHMLGGTITAGTAAVVITGEAAINSCVMTMTPTVTGKGVTWAYTISRSDKTPLGEKCDPATTGIGT